MIANDDRPPFDPNEQARLAAHFGLTLDEYLAEGAKDLFAGLHARHGACTWCEAKASWLIDPSQLRKSFPHTCSCGSPCYDSGFSVKCSSWRCPNWEARS